MHKSLNRKWVKYLYFYTIIRFLANKESEKPKNGSTFSFLAAMGRETQITEEVKVKKPIANVDLKRQSILNNTLRTAGLVTYLLLL